MEKLEQLRDWLDARRDYAFEVVRIVLGLLLFAQGLYFITHVGEVRTLLERSGVHLDFVTSLTLGHYVALAHLCGGLMLAAGMVTRLAATLQIPVLVGAVFLVHLRQGLFGPGQNLMLALLVLVLLVLCVVHGGGKLSVDHALARHMRFAQSPEPW